MEREAIKQLFGINFIGKEELKPFFQALGEDILFDELPILYSESELTKASKENYILIYGVDNIKEKKISLRNLRERFGINADMSEPCFYNQDWYMHEDFIDKSLSKCWYLIKKDVFEDCRAILPDDLLKNRDIKFPTAILCAYTFFAYYFKYGEYLWLHDFIWCSDLDHNGDRIYVGKYHDIDGINKNGFSIHRHLALRSCYSSINLL